jgi:hypothetical protein
VSYIPRREWWVDGPDDEDDGGLSTELPRSITNTAIAVVVAAIASSVALVAAVVWAIVRLVLWVVS